MKRIIIIGDGARGKTTLAKNLSKKLGIPYHSTDDYYWETKYSKKADKIKSLKQVTKLYKEDSWIVEGATKRLLEPGLERADLIIWLRHKSLTRQIYFTFKRYATRKEEHFMNFLRLCRHFFYRRFGLSYEKYVVQFSEFLEPYMEKVVELSSFKEINEYLKKYD